MTESEWLTCSDPEEMWGAVPAIQSKRRLRLIGCASCRRIWQLLSDEHSRQAVEGAELFADGRIPEQTLDRHSREAQDLWEEIDDKNECARAGGAVPATYVSLLHFDVNVLRNTMGAATRSVRMAAMDTAGEVVPIVHLNAEGDLELEATPVSEAANQERAAQAEIVRDILGNPFRPPPPIALFLLTWHDGLIKRLAEQAYEHRIMPAGTLDPDRLAVLSDALEEAGADAALVAHLREAVPHWRGCFALDLILKRS